MDWKSTWKLEFQSNVFDDVRNKFVSAYCIVTSNVLTVTDENHKRCIFQKSESLQFTFLVNGMWINHIFSNASYKRIWSFEFWIIKESVCYVY